MCLRCKSSSVRNALHHCVFFDSFVITLFPQIYAAGSIRKGVGRSVITGADSCPRLLVAPIRSSAWCGCLRMLDGDVVDRDGILMSLPTFSSSHFFSQVRQTDCCAGSADLITWWPASVPWRPAGGNERHERKQLLVRGSLYRPRILRSGFLSKHLFYTLQSSCRNNKLTAIFIVVFPQRLRVLLPYSLVPGPFHPV